MYKRNISMKSVKKLGKLLAFIGESEQHIEYQRQNLCKLKAFEPYATFQRIDRAAKGYVTPRDLANFLR